TGAAHAEVDLGAPLASALRTRIWNCGSIVVVEPNDPIWKYDRANFTKGTLRMAIWHGHLTFEQSAVLPNAPCVRMPLLDGYTLSSSYFLQNLSLPLVY